MISPDLLKKLQERDPKAYDLIQSLKGECSIIGRQVLEKTIIQAVIEDKIRTKNWAYRSYTDQYGSTFEIIFEKGNRTDYLRVVREGRFPAEASLMCYLAAIQQL